MIVTYFLRFTIIFTITCCPFLLLINLVRTKMIFMRMISRFQTNIWVNTDFRKNVYYHNNYSTSKPYNIISDPDMTHYSTGSQLMVRTTPSGVIGGYVTHTFGLIYIFLAQLKFGKFKILLIIIKKKIYLYMFRNYWLIEPDKHKKNIKYACIIYDTVIKTHTCWYHYFHFLPQKIHTLD